MHILIANDDGIDAPGLHALVRAFAAAGHEISVCAPDRQRSAASHSLTIAGEMTARPAEVPGAARAWAISGTPADCVKLGLSVLCPTAEAVLSGINHGYNAGSDVLYSGTVAAAMEGALAGLPAMAVSNAHSRPDTYDQAARLALAMWPHLDALSPHTLLNLNYPAMDEALGIKAAPLRRLVYDDAYVACGTEADGAVRYCLRGMYREEGQAPDDDDRTWLAKGYATVTVLGYDMADASATQAVRDRLRAGGA